MHIFNFIHYFHKDHNEPCLPPKVLHNHCFQFLRGITMITVVPREIEDDGYANLGAGVGGGGGGYKVHYGLCEKGE